MIYQVIIQVEILANMSNQILNFLFDVFIVFIPFDNIEDRENLFAFIQNQFDV